MPYELPAMKTRQNISVEKPIARMTEFNWTPDGMMIIYSIYATLDDAYADQRPEPISTFTLYIGKDRVVSKPEILDRDGDVLVPAEYMPSIADIRSNPEVEKLFDATEAVIEQTAKLYKSELAEGKFVAAPGGFEMKPPKSKKKKLK